jgi:hypothetical protein
MTRHMTYDEIAETFGIKPNSARQLVNRKRWMKRKGNDGRLRVDVPLEALREAPSEALHEASREASHVAPREALHEAPTIELLRRLIERLEGELAELRPRATDRDMLALQMDVLRQERDTLRQERDLERQRASSCNVLAAQLDAERRRSEELRVERDRWAVQAHALAHPPVPHVPPVVERRGLFGWLRRAG